MRFAGRNNSCCRLRRLLLLVLLLYGRMNGPYRTEFIVHMLQRMRQHIDNGLKAFGDRFLAARHIHDKRRAASNAADGTRQVRKFRLLQTVHGHAQRQLGRFAIDATSRRFGRNVTRSETGAARCYDEIGAQYIAVVAEHRLNARALEECDSLG